MLQTIDKPWGKEEIIEINDKYMVKKLTMYKGNQCSLQYHRNKTETIYVLSGILRVYYSLRKYSKEYIVYEDLECGDTVTLYPGTVHRMKAINNTEYIESSSPEIDDVVRLEDDYGRG